MNNKEKKTHSMKARGMISDVGDSGSVDCTLKLQYTERILCYQLFPKGIYAS